jgi:hypothetical protein
MFEYQQLLGPRFLEARDPQLTRALNPSTRDFAAWLRENAERIPIA